MPRFSVWAASTVAAALLLSACSGSSGASTDSSPPVDSSPVATAAGPIPEVEGGFGVRPTITAPDEDPADALVTKTLVTGDGAVVASGDLLVVNYLGQIWDSGTIFDESFARESPASFGIGVGRVIAGWDSALVGQTVGSRIVMAIPPSLGYGDQGNEQAGIAGDDTLIFVVDILAAYPADATPAAGASPAGADLTGLPSVDGDINEQPAIKISASTDPPAKKSTVVLDTGEGPEVEAGSFVLLQYEAVSWDGTVVGSTWQEGQLFGVLLGLSANPFDGLIGLPVGTRAMILIPAEGDNDPATDSIVVVAEIIDSIPPAS